MIHMYSIPPRGFWLIATPAKIAHSTTCQHKTAYFMKERMVGLQALGTYTVDALGTLADNHPIKTCGAAWFLPFIQPNLELHYFEMEGSGLDYQSQELVDMFIAADEREVLSQEPHALLTAIPYAGFWEISKRYVTVRQAPAYNRETAQLIYEFIEQHKADYFGYWEGHYLDRDHTIPLELDGVTWISRKDYQHEHAVRLFVPLSRLPVHFANLLTYGTLNPELTDVDFKGGVKPVGYKDLEWDISKGYIRRIDRNPPQK